MKTVFEQMGGTYASQGDYLIPDFILSEKEQREIGVWGTTAQALSETVSQGSLLQSTDKWKAQ